MMWDGCVQRDAEKSIACCFGLEESSIGEVESFGGGKAGEVDVSSFGEETLCSGCRSRYGVSKYRSEECSRPT